MYLDILLGLILIVTLLCGLKNGFLVEFMSTFGVILNFIITKKITPIVIETLGEYLKKYESNYIYGIVFLIVFILLSILIHILNIILKKQRIYLISRILGGILSLAKGIILVIIILFCYNLLEDNFEKVSKYGEDSKINRCFIENSDKLNSYIPDVFKKKMIEIKDEETIDKYVNKLF